MFAREYPRQSIKKQQKLPQIWKIGIRPAVRRRWLPADGTGRYVSDLYGSGRNILLWKENTDDVIPSRSLPNFLTIKVYHIRQKMSRFCIDFYEIFYRIKRKELSGYRGIDMLKTRTNEPEYGDISLLKRTKIL